MFLTMDKFLQLYYTKREKKKGVLTLDKRLFSSWG